MRYATSKLAVLMWTRHCGEVFKKDNVYMNVVHPGVVATNFGSSETWTIHYIIIASILYLFGRVSLRNYLVMYYSWSDKKQGNDL